MGPSYRDEIMEHVLQIVDAKLKGFQGQIWSSRAGALGTTSYEQYYAQKNIRTKGIDQIFQGLKTMPPVDEDHLGTIASHSCRPLLPGKESSENTDMLPGFLEALMSLDGAEDITRSSVSKTRNIKVGKFIVEDTHKKMYLGGCSPDLTLRLAGSPLCAFGSIATGSLDNKHRGKAVKYTEELLEANPDRPFALCLLTNTEELQVFRASRTTNQASGNEFVFECSDLVSLCGGTFSFNTLKDILGALSHMHLNLKLVHRDIEPKHMGLDAQGVPCLIDVGSAVSMDETTADEILSGARPYYSGTLLFASDEVLDGLESGCVCVPKAAQDMVALVKSAYIMLHAGAEQSLMRCFPMNGSPEEKVTAVKSFWSTELSKETPAGNAWRELLSKAHSIDAADSSSYTIAVAQLQADLGKFLRAKD
ncbi:hypothetical protein CEUSTIGMA_g13839.t1 [Chlamydomonas eustigma]|uniref:Protein kinase domain-containing protein n=1 Tax=Chlamydomonas eustigma TaxID=1157962 RepID=A0A250XTX7_9CHLO|nr:hypothetical protein CEUSTIGMA_g13839.t1 [Chlamydomonas eustigma]|eukprot:GAX86429.1 hypothetical protein CEUSTIGMA_g13839.t1 [Chlamydomonas eustigma]